MGNVPVYQQCTPCVDDASTSQCADDAPTVPSRHRVHSFQTETCVDLQTSELIDYILHVSNMQLLEAWQSVDVNDNEQINIQQELHLIFLHLIHKYIESETQQQMQNSRAPKGPKVQKSDYEALAISSSHELSGLFQTVLVKLGYHDVDKMAKDFYLECFQEYMSDRDTLSGTETCTITSSDSGEVESAAIAALQTQTSHDHEFAIKLNGIGPFDMLPFISTASTLEKHGRSASLGMDHDQSLLCEALKMPPRVRGEKVGEVLCTMTESQRVCTRYAFDAANDESFQTVLTREFDGHLLTLLLELSRSSPYNDAEWIEKARVKQNLDVMNEILLSRTNAQLSALKHAYMDRFGVALLDALLQSSSSSISYAMIVQCVLSDDAQIMRKEEAEESSGSSNNHQHTQVYEDAKLLYRTHEDAKLDKSAVIKVLCRRSWSHLAQVCNEYGKKSMFDLKSMIERRFGKHSKSGNALQHMIDVARNRHSFFAQLLLRSFNKMSTDHDTLIRILVGRSEIDLGEIIAVFSHQYGNGNTLFQFINEHTPSGSYRNLLLRFCGLDSDQFMIQCEYLDDSDDDESKDSRGNHGRVVSHLWLPPLANDVAEDQPKGSIPRPVATWQQFICCAPTITQKSGFNAVRVTQDLLAVIHDKTKTDVATRLMIETLTDVTNRQRQQLKTVFWEVQTKNPNSKLELFECIERTLSKGNTMTVLLMLLLRPAEFHCFWMKQAIKRKDVELLVEVLCSLTNYEIVAMSDYYFKSEKSELMADIHKHIIGNKKTAQWIIAKMLEAKRPEYVEADQKMGKLHLSELTQVLQRKQQKECKQFFAKFCVENAYSQLKYEMDKFNTSSEKTLASVVKKAMGSGHSAVILETILKMANNRYAFYCEKLRDAMKGIGVSQDVLIRILVGRSEKDLADIIEYFAANNYGDGTTLKQCLENAVSGSFRTSLLRVAALYTSYKHLAADSYQAEAVSDYESRSDTEEVPVVYSPIAQDVKTPTVDTMATGAYLRSAEPIVSSDDENENDAPAEETVQAADPKPTTKVPPPVMTASQAPSSVSMDAMEAAAAVNFSPVPLEVVEEEKQLDVYDINEEELGRFIMEKLNEETADKLIQRLNTKKKKGTSKQLQHKNVVETIEAKQVIFMLLFACILFMKYQAKTEKREPTAIDNTQLKRSLTPACAWILQTKFQFKKSLKKSDYKLLGAWLIEYYGYKS